MSQTNIFEAFCVCGQGMAISRAQIGRHVVCPACNRVLIPVDIRPANTPESAVAPAPRPHVPPAALRACPFCGEMILPTARKCRHCGEFLPAPAAEEAGGRPRHEPASPADDSADPVFLLRVSQWDNFWRYLTCAMVLIVAGGAYLVPAIRPWAGTILAVVAATVAVALLFIYLGARTSICLISSHRIETRAGIFTRRIDWVSMGTVLDIQLKQSFIQRLLGIGTIVVKSTDQVTPRLEIYHAPQARMAFEYLQQQIARHGRVVVK